MTRPPRKGRRHKLHLELSEGVHKRLVWLEEVSEADSRTEVIRRALRLYEVVLRAQQDGRELILRAADEERTIEFL